MKRKKSYKYKVYDGKLIKEIFENSRLYLLLAFFICGVLIGSIAIKNTDSIIINEIRSIVDSYKALRMQEGLTNSFLFSLTINLVFVILSVFLGFSLIGYPLIMWIPFARGLGIGVVCGYLYSEFKFAGLGYAVLTLYPAAVIAITSIVISCNDSCEYSKNAYRKAILGRGQFERGETKIFLTRQAVFCGICALSSLIDALCSSVFSRLFIF